MRILLLSLAIACISACGFVGFPGVYRINVEQGNIVKPEMVGQLKPGMNRRQVRFILGTPLVENTFDQNRWDYIYVKRNGTKVLSESRLTVEFDGDALVNLSGDLVPTDWAAKSDTAPATTPVNTSETPPDAEPRPGIPTGG
jgi:outer membrane protein assembly factor BamE